MSTTHPLRTPWARPVVGSAATRSGGACTSLPPALLHRMAHNRQNTKETQQKHSARLTRRENPRPKHREISLRCTIMLRTRSVRAHATLTGDAKTHHALTLGLGGGRPQRRHRHWVRSRLARGKSITVDERCYCCAETRRDYLEECGKESLPKTSRATLAGTLPPSPAGGDDGPPRLLRGARPPRPRAARRPGRRQLPFARPLPRPRALLRCAVRSARLRPLDAPRPPARQHPSLRRAFLPLPTLRAVRLKD